MPLYTKLIRQAVLFSLILLPLASCSSLENNFFNDISKHADRLDSSEEAETQGYLASLDTDGVLTGGDAALENKGTEQVLQTEHTIITDDLSDLEKVTATDTQDAALAGQTADEPNAPAPAEELTSPEPEETVAQEVKELEALGKWEEGTPVKMTEQGEITFDFPITMNRQVEFYLDFFQNKQRKTFARWLTRSSRYIPLVKQELKAAGLPTDLAYLPLIESGYSLTAYSRAHAVGPWQFIKGTARKFDLTINNYVDERRDPIKSTKAAVAYLSCLYDEFNSWHLAVAGYNAGEGKIRRAIKKYNTTNFWEIAQKSYLRPETKRYVPKLIAAIMIAKEPEKYGFYDIDYDKPLSFETVTVPRWTTIKAVAIAVDEDFEELRNLNRELRRAITPPYASSYTIKVPVGTKELVAKNLNRVVPIMTTEYKTHVVRHGETLTRICRKYNLNKTTILKANDLRSSKLMAGKRLRIPFRTTSYKLLAENETPSFLGPGIISDENLILHKVRPGETISEISKRYGAPPIMIAAWNDLESIHQIRAGQQLALYLKDTENSNSSLVSEARAMNQLAAVNLTSPSKIAPQNSFGQDTSASDANPEPTYYKVRGGDTLWTIARRYNITTEQIKRWNSIKGDLIKPGLRLMLRIPKDADA